MSVPVPTNEIARLAALLHCGVLDSPPEPQFDDVARLAGQVCGTPIALVSLVDEDRQWFKARVGLALSETSRELSFCAHAVASGHTLIVPDALRDERFATNPLVTDDPSIRFYAGVPLTLDEGLTLGTLCVIDRVPRELSAVQIEALTALARQVTTELRLRRTLASVRPPPMDAPPGRGVEDQLVGGRYRIERVLGAGGMGIVVAARDSTSGASVAIKFMLPRAHDAPALLERFVREARAVLAVDSEHVARVLDVGNLPGGAPYIVMELLEGKDLDQLVAARGPLPVHEAVDALLQTCAAVGHAHAVGVLHRDLKPANLFRTERVDGSGHIKVLDFGVSKFWEATDPGDRQNLTGASEILGSPEYMSPEATSGQRDLDARTDIWSLGVVLYELLTGDVPFTGSTPAEVGARVLTATPRSLRELREDVPEGLAVVVARCLARERDERYPSVDALAAALRRFGSEGFIEFGEGPSAGTAERAPRQDATASEPLAPDGVVSPAPGRPSWRALALVAIVLVVVAWAAWAAMQ